jgi:pimeloyl-[acyl-carrier protein] methyl ester esterase
MDFMSAPLEVIAMHGWAGDARCWEPWRTATGALGWQWHCGERGYGALEPRQPAWGESGSGNAGRLFIGHSLGPHLVPAEILRQADTVVLLASFGTFVPPGRSGRRVCAALSGMAAPLGDEERARTMLKNFMIKVAEPQSPEALPIGPVDEPLTEAGRERLREDLELLGRCAGLPEGFPHQARVLIVEAGEDRIVEPEARALLREALPEADIVALPGIGHALLAGNVIGRVVEWVEAARHRSALGGSGGPALPPAAIPG